MTREQWDADDANRAALAKALAQPEIKDALDLLLSANFPGSADSAQRGADINAYALKRVYDEGYYDFYRRLVALSVHKKFVPTAQPQPWAHAVERADKEEESKRIRAKG